MPALGHSLIEALLSAEERARRFARAHRALRTVAVTGTNGKTTTTTLIDAIVATSGEPHARLTTLGADVNGAPVSAQSATEEFLLAVEGAVEAGVRTLALEMTSKALAGGLAARWRPSIAVFTNLTRDHLDMHGSPEAYLAAKAQLFLALPGDGVAVLNRDDPSSALLDEILPTTVTRRWYSLVDPAADLSTTEIDVSAAGTRISLAPSPLADALGTELHLSLFGRVHAANALAAALAAESAGYSPAAIRAGLVACPGVEGRFWPVGRRPLVVVDYAHTPDALAGTLRTARELAGERGRVLLVFGCGGMRDRGKRPAMGALAHDLADRVYLTNDNPRRERPEAIAVEVRAGARGEGAEWCVELDRRRAIAAAIHQAEPADVVVIAGKGHEATQEIGGQILPFSDATVAAESHRVRRPLGERA